MGLASRPFEDNFHEGHALSPGFPHTRCGGGETFLCRWTWLYVGSGGESCRHVRTCWASTRGASDEGIPVIATRQLSPPLRPGILVERLVATVLGYGAREKVVRLPTA